MQNNRIPKELELAYYHVRNRARGRYNIELTLDDYQRIYQKINKQKATVINSTNGDVYMVYYGGLAFPVAYQPSSKAVVTMLPEDYFIKTLGHLYTPHPIRKELKRLWSIGFDSTQDYFDFLKGLESRRPLRLFRITTEKTVQIHEINEQRIPLVFSSRYDTFLQVLPPGSEEKLDEIASEQKKTEQERQHERVMSRLRRSLLGAGVLFPTAAEEYNELYDEDEIYDDERQFELCQHILDETTLVMAVLDEDLTAFCVLVEDWPIKFVYSYLRNSVIRFLPPEITPEEIVRLYQQEKIRIPVKPIPRVFSF